LKKLRWKKLWWKDLWSNRIWSNKFWPNRISIYSFFLLFCLPAFAVTGDEVKYVGGTLPGAIPGIVGRLDTTSPASLTFLHAGNRTEIPYSSIKSFEYSKEVTHHLGVLPAIVVSLLKMRQHRHFFRLSYDDQNSVAQAVVFEVPKTMPRSLRAVLEARAPAKAKPARTCSSSSDWDEPTWSNF